MKIFKLILLLFIVFLLVDYFGRSPLVKEIASLEDPVPFEKRPIDSITQKYFLFESTKEQIINNFKTNGFIVYEDKDAPRRLDCAQCDEIFLRGIYDFKFLYIIPTYRIVIDIGFQNEHAVVITGTYLLRMP